MITLLGSLLGFGTSFLPEVLNYFKAGQEHKHNLERMQLEMDMMTKRNELQLNVMDKQAEIKETEGLYKHDSIDAGWFINGLRGSVRPVITYVFFALFVAIKVCGEISGKAIAPLALLSRFAQYNVFVRPFLEVVNSFL